jgi:hypothetical protein
LHSRRRVVAGRRANALTRVAHEQGNCSRRDACAGCHVFRTRYDSCLRDRKGSGGKADADAPVKAKKVARKKANASKKAAKADSKPAKKLKIAKAKTAKKKFKPFVPET